MKTTFGRWIAVAVVAVTVLAALVVLWPSAAFAPTAVEYAAGPLSIGGSGDDQVRVAFFNTTDREALVVIALVDLDGNPLVGPTKPEPVGPGKGITLDFKSGDPLVVIALMEVSRQMGNVLPGATFQIVDGTSNTRVTTSFIEQQPRR